MGVSVKLTQTAYTAVKGCCGCNATWRVVSSASECSRPNQQRCERGAVADST